MMPRFQMTAFVEFLLLKKVGVVDEDGEPTGANCSDALSGVARQCLTTCVRVRTWVFVGAGVGGVAEEDISVTYSHEGSRSPDIVWCVRHIICSGPRLQSQFPNALPTTLYAHYV